MNAAAKRPRRGQDPEEARAVERYAKEFGVSMDEAWAERAKWKAESVIRVESRLVLDSEQSVRDLEVQLKAAREELRRRQRIVSKAERERDAAEQKIAALRRR